MKPKNVANWLKTHLYRVLKHMDKEQLKNAIWQLQEQLDSLDHQDRVVGGK